MLDKIMRELTKTRDFVQEEGKAEKKFVRKMTALISEEMDKLTPQERNLRLEAFEASTSSAIASSRAKRQRR